jgi:hypothetical protein
MSKRDGERDSARARERTHVCMRVSCVSMACSILACIHTRIRICEYLLKYLASSIQQRTFFFNPSSSLRNVFLKHNKEKSKKKSRSPSPSSFIFDVNFFYYIS